MAKFFAFTPSIRHSLIWAVLILEAFSTSAGVTLRRRTALSLVIGALAFVSPNFGTSLQAQIAPNAPAASNNAAIPGFPVPSSGASATIAAPVVPSLQGPFPPEDQPALPDSSPNSANESATNGAAALTGAATSATNSQIGVARHFLYKFRVGSRFVFDDNIFLSPESPQSDEFLVLDGDVTLGLGDPTGAGNYLRFEYSPSASFYIEHSAENALQHSISLAGLYQFSKLTVSGRIGIQLLDGTDLTTTTAAGAQSTQANLDVSGRTKLNLYTGQVDFNYAFSDKTSADLAAQYSISDYEVLLSSENFNGSFFMNYVFSPKLTFGAGATLGEVFSTQPNPNETYYQLNLRTNYEATGKISVAGTLGIEFRTSEASDAVQIGPVFNLNAVYLPFDATALSLSAQRQTTPSAVQGGQNFVTTDFSVSFRQRFFQRYFASLTTGYQNLSYVSTTSGATATREDNYFYVQGGVDMTVHENVNIGLALLHRNSDSSLRTAGFDDNQVTFSVSYSF